MLNLFQSLFESYYYSPLHHILIVIHVATALIALLVAPVAMAVTKGGRTHILWGRVYFWAMFVTNSLALWLLYWRFNTFLFGVVVISFYASLTGYRAIYRKHTPALWHDWAISWLALLTGAGLFLWGLLTGLGLTQQIIPGGENLNLVATILPIIFGLSVGHDAWTDLRSFRTPSPDRRWWWYYHMERMLGSYIGLTTALMVQQVAPRMEGNLAWIAWVAPTAIGIPLISLWIGRYRRKFAAPKHPITAEPTLTNS